MNKFDWQTVGPIAGLAGVAVALAEGVIR